MKKIICLILFLICLCSECFAQNIKFIQVTDVHLTKNNVPYLENFVSDINTKTKFKDLDFIVFTGDNIDKANPEDLILFLDTIKKLNVKPYVLVGNHDLFKSHNLTKEIYMTEVRKKLGTYHPAKANYIFKKKDVIFITMNGVKEVIPGPFGYFRQDELMWLDKMLTKYSNKKVVILQHFPLLDSKTKNHNLYKKEDYEKVLSKHNNVISIISGHYHENREQKEENIYHIITKNFQNNTFYKIIEIDSDNNMIYTQLVDNNEI